MLRFCFMLWFHLFHTLECVIVTKPGENVTLTCSFKDCLQSIDGYFGMYLYHQLIEKRQVFYYKRGSSRGIVERKGYVGRIESNQSFMNLSFTINNLTVDDSGIYSCVYIKGAHDREGCNVHTVFVRGKAPCAPTAAEQRSPVLLAAIIVVACVISILMTIILILLTVPKVKRWKINRRKGRPAAPESNEYEVMNKYSFRPAAAQGSQLQV